MLSDWGMEFNYEYLKFIKFMLLAIVDFTFLQIN